MFAKLTTTFIPLLISGLLSSVAIAAPGAHGPDGEHLDTPTTSTTNGLARLPDGSVNVPKQAQRRIGIRTVMVAAGEYPLSVHLNGRVGIDPNAGGRVQAPFTGRIEPGPKGLPVVGQEVKKGQVLVNLRPVGGAIERSNQQAQLAEIRANRTLAEQRVKRLESLEGTVPQKEIEAARAELKSLVGQEQAVRASVSGSDPITAPASGVVASANVLNGQIVDAREVLFEIVDPKRLIIEATATDASLATRIRSATLAAIPDVELTLLGVGRSLREGALPVNFRASSQNAVLAIGQPVTVIAHLADKVKGIAVPAAAVVRSAANEPVVWIKSGSERFIAQPVEIRPLNAQTVVVLKGLAPENRVVVTGAALINQIR